MNAKTAKKPSARKPPQEVPQYQKRRTVADHVRDNMLCSGKQNYHQRIIFVAHHLNPDKKNRSKEVRKVLQNLVVTTNQQAASDKLTGMMVFYSSYSICMLEGAEDNIGNFMKSVKNEINNLFDASRVVLIYNNSNRRFFEKMFYSYATAQETFSSNDLEELEIVEDIIQRLTTVCLKIVDNPSIIDDRSNLQLRDVDILPPTQMIDKILKITNLQTIEAFADIYGFVPEFVCYKSHVWPHPYDFLPDNVFDWGKFDVNLTRK